MIIQFPKQIEFRMEAWGIAAEILFVPQGKKIAAQSPTRRGTPKQITNLELRITIENEFYFCEVTVLLQKFIFRP